MFRHCVAYSSESGTNHTAGQTNIFERRQVTPGLVGEILLQQVVHTQQATKGSVFNADGCFCCAVEGFVKQWIVVGNVRSHGLCTA